MSVGGNVAIVGGTGNTNTIAVFDANITGNLDILSNGRFALKGRGAFQVLPAQVPVQFVSIFGAEPQRAAGQCGQRLFNPNTAAKLRCKMTRSGDLLSCR